MEMEECFQVLGINETTDEKKIKNAYREKLSDTNPEDDPEGFKRLRKAYEDACRYAKNPDVSTQNPAADLKDDTPSGKWMEKVEAVYGNILRRQDEKAWEVLFREDAFISLEDEENCRTKLLAFMMTHFRFPTHIWRLFDAKLQIRGKEKELREKFPAEFVQYLITKCTRGEDLDFAEFEGDMNADYDKYLQYYDNCWNATQKGELKEARDALGRAETMGIYHPAMGICKAYLLDKEGKHEEALKLICRLKEKYTKDQVVRYNAAEFLWKYDKKQDAGALYESLKEENDAHYMANVRLSQWYYEQGEFKKAKKCADKVLRGGVDENFMALLRKINAAIEVELEADFEKNQKIETGLELGWCYLQDGRVNKGLRLVKNLGGVPGEKKAEYYGLLVKLYMEDGNAERVLEISPKWSEALKERLDGQGDYEERERDVDRMRQCHFIRMHAFRIVGNTYSHMGKTDEFFHESAANFRNALSEAEQARINDSLDISVDFEEASIYLDMGDYEKSLDICERLIEEKKMYAAYVTELEVYMKQGLAPGIVKAAKACIQAFPEYLRAYEQLGRVYLNFKMKEDLELLLEDAKKNHVESLKLSAYEELIKLEELPDSGLIAGYVKKFRSDYLTKVEGGMMQFFEQGEQRITRLIHLYPINYLFVERANYYFAAGHLEEALKDFEKALVEEPYNPYILRGVSGVFRNRCDYEKALIFAKRAYRYRDEGMENALLKEIYELYFMMGDYKNAAFACGKYLGDGRRSLPFQDIANYVFSLAGIGETEKAVQLLADSRLKEEERKAATIEMYQISGKKEEAEALLKEWGNTREIKAARAFSGITFGGGGKNTAYSLYMERLCWQEALYKSFSGKAILGNKDKVSKALDILAERNENKLCDALFFAILGGNEKKGRLYSKKLEKYLNGASFEAADRYHARKREYLRIKALSSWYKETFVVWDILKEADGEPLCGGFGESCFHETDSLKVLLLFREKKQEEAAEQLRKAFKEQPMNKYLKAINNLLGVSANDSRN